MDFLERIRTRARERRLGRYLGEHARHGVCELQHDMNAANASGATVRGDYNNALASLVSLSSGATAPAITFAYQLWADTTAAVLKRRNAANTGWLVVRSLDETTVLSRSSNTILDISDIGKTIRATGSFTQTLDAVATLGDGWWINYLNEGTGVVTFDPNSAETIGGQTTLAFGPGESGTIVCNGATLQIVNRSRYSGAIGVGRNIAAKNNAATPNTKIDITAGELQLKDDNGNVKVALAVSVTIDYAGTGANGIDTGAQALNTWYYNWIIAKEDGTVAGLGSLSSSAPTMPSGYTFKALVNAARSNASTQFLKHRQVGNEVIYEARQSVLSGGSATTETAISLSEFVPPNALSASISYQGFAASSAGGSINVLQEFRYISGTTFFSDQQFLQGLSNSVTQSVGRGAFEVPNVSQQIYYLVTFSTGSADTGLSVWVNGFKLPMGGE
jgi:hypothetical protein